MASLGRIKLSEWAPNHPFVSGVHFGQKQPASSKQGSQMKKPEKKSDSETKPVAPTAE